MFVRKLRVRVRAERLAIDARAALTYGWKPKKDAGRLQQHIAHAGLQRRRGRGIVVAGVCVLELEPDDQETGADADAAHRAVRGGRVRADERGRVGPGRGDGGEREERGDPGGSYPTHETSCCR